MDNPNQPPWPPPRDPGNVRSPWQEVRRRAGAAYGPDPDQRIGDAERSEMADILGKHYSDGRLDESEFRERLDRAMSAKTRGDLSGLLSDLPPLGQPQFVPPPPPPHRRARRMRTLAFVLLGLVLFTSLGAAWGPFHVPWFLVALVAFLVLRNHHGHGWRRYGRYSGPYQGYGGPGGWSGPPPPPPQQYPQGSQESGPWR